MKVDNNDRVRIHDLNQDVGREIIRQESISVLGKRSRLWFDDDIVYVLQNDTVCKIHHHDFVFLFIPLFLVLSF